MRRITSKEELEKKRKRNLTLVSVIILLVLVFGTVGYAFLTSSRFDSNGNPKASGKDVVSYGNGYIANFNGQNLYFTSSLESVKDIPVEISSTLNNFVSSSLYISSDSEAITREIAINLGKYTARAQEACYGSCEKDLPEKNCTENLIVWNDSSENKVYQKENCIFIEGDMRAADALLYTLFGFKQ